MDATKRFWSATGTPKIPLGRRGLLLVALAAVAGGLVLNWGWLAAIGVAPVILSLAPCALMCAAGFCMACRSRSCAEKSASVAEPHSATLTSNRKGDPR